VSAKKCTRTIVLAEWPPRRGSKVGRTLDWARRIGGARPDEFSMETYEKARRAVADALITAMLRANYAQETSRIADSLSARERELLLRAVTFNGAAYRGAGGWQTYRGLRRKKLVDGWAGWANPTRLGRRVARVLGGGQ
jgi:hypothetical protein